jgi:hypothetical protein
VFENRVLRRIFGPKRDEVTGEWRKLHNGELHNLYSSPDIVRQIKSKMRRAGHVVCMGEGTGKGPLERPRRRWEDAIKRTFGRLVGGCGVDSPGSGKGSLAGCCECGDEPSGSGATELVMLSTDSSELIPPKFLLYEY